MPGKAVNMGSVSMYAEAAPSFALTTDNTYKGRYPGEKDYAGEVLDDN